MKEGAKMIKELHRSLIENFEQLVSWRRYLHRYPELSFQEENTPKFIAEKLSSFGIEVKTGIGGNGVIGMIKGGKEGKTIAFRADFDALPIHEENDSPYRSSVKGVMHACGHDGHTAALLGVAKVLSEIDRSRLKGNIVFIFQHAEEKPPGGAKFMIEDGCLDDVDLVFGAHVSTDIPYGKIGLREGPVMAAVDAFTIQIKGKGGHGARPHETVDALVIGSQIVNYLQQIVSRRVNPIDSAVVTVGVFQAGTAFNVIAENARIEGTVRTFNPNVRKQIEEEIRAIVQGLCQASHASYEIDYLNGYPPVINPRNETEQLRAIISETYASDCFYNYQPSMGAEDFAYYLKHKPGVYFHVGARGDDPKTHYPHHHPRFDFDERALLVSGKIFLSIVNHYLLQ